MQRGSKFKTDYYGGALMVLIGLAAANASRGYHIGTPSQMGPGFFPMAIGVLLAFMGVLIALAARSPKAELTQEEGKERTHSHPTGLPDLRGAVCIILSILGFLAVGEYGGLVPATFVTVFIAALGDRTNTVKQALLLSASMSVVAVVVFWWALQLQLPLFQWGG